MSKQIENMDDLFREKMQNFAPSPPEHIWTGIEKNLARKPFYILLLNNWKTFQPPHCVLLLISLGSWYFMSDSNAIEENTSPLNEKTETILSEKNEIETEILESAIEPENSAVPNTELKTDSKPGYSDNELNSDEQIIKNSNNAELNYSENDILEQNSNQEFSEKSLIVQPDANAKTQVNQFMIPDKNEHITISGVKSMQNTDIDFYNPLDLTVLSLNPVHELPKLKINTPQKGSWKMGLYFTPEVFLNDFDSVRMLTAYSFNIEPIYYFNSSWFLRFGHGCFINERPWICKT